MLQKTTTTKKEAILRSREWRTVLDATELLWSWSIDPFPLIHLEEQLQQRFRWGDHHFKIGHKHAAFTAWVIYIPHLSFVPKTPMYKLGHHPRVTRCLEELKPWLPITSMLWALGVASPLGSCTPTGSFVVLHRSFVLRSDSFDLKSILCDHCIALCLSTFHGAVGLLSFAYCFAPT